MSKVLVEESSLHGVGNGIRYVNGKNTTYKPSEFEDAIKDLKPNLGTKTLTENGTFPASGDNLDGFSAVTVAVPPTTAVLVEKEITENGDYDPLDDDADGYSAVSVEVPNSYAAEDEGKVVDGGELVAQTQKSISTNGTHDTTTNDEVVVAVPNSYGAGDEGKVVSSGALVSQTSRTISENGTYDTTLNNEVIVDAAGDLEHLSVTENGVYTPGTGVDGFDQVSVNVVGSSDGTLPGALSLIAYGAGVFAAIGNEDTWAVSADGTGWYEVPAFALTGYDIGWGGLVYGCGKFVAYGQIRASGSSAIVRSVIVCSSDGITWTEASSYGTVNYINGIVAGDNAIVCFVSNSNKALVSADGTVWAEVTLPVTWAGTVYGQAAYTNGVFLAVGRMNDAGNTGMILTSDDDGETWTAAQTISDIRDALIGAADGRFVALPRIGAGSDTGYYSDDDGASWDEVTLPTENTWGEIAYGGGRFVATCADNAPYVLVSWDDGYSWQVNTFVRYMPWSDIAYGGGVFVAVSAPNAIAVRFGQNLAALTVTENGTYTPTGGVDGFSSVVVNVPSGGGGSSIVTGSWVFDILNFDSSAEENV